MKLIHSADLHKDREHYALLEASLDVIEDAAFREKVSLIALAGDLHDGAEQNSERDGHDAFGARLQRLADIAPLVMVEGTPSHDVPGSLAIYERLSSTHGIHILRPGTAYFLEGGRITTTRGSATEAILFGIPEPQKKWLLANGGATGKDDADAAVRAAMGALLLGLGGIRRQHSDLPCVVLYHGQVSGAKTGTGYSAGSGIAISRDDLAAVAADYYALGDIHFPQQILGIPAYYPGKAYPDGWNEQNYQFGCNLVSIEPNVHETGGGFFSFGYLPWKTDVSRISFPHPECIKLSIKTGDRIPWDPPAAPISGKRVWLEYTAPKDEAVDLEFWERALRDAGAAPGSKATINPIPVETVRAAEIAALPSLRQKVGLWGENSSQVIPEAVLAKADELEGEVGPITALAGTPRRFRNVSTRLRGAKGFWRRQRKDEVFIDWESYGEGVVAYIGPNGFGKTTSFDFSKPWPVPVSRRPKTLKSHFRLRDSAIENVYLEEVSGIRYRVLINIDGATKSGGAEYFLFRDEGRGWQPLEGINGRQDPFLEAVEGIFGPLAIYLRTAYVPQKPSKDFPDISEATQEEKKGLIAELAGKDFSEYQAAAKARGDGEEQEIALLEARLAATVGVDEEIAALLQDIAYQESKAKEAAARVETSRLRKAGLERQVAEARSRLGTLERSAERAAEVEREIQAIQADFEKVEAEIALFRKAAEGRGAAEAELAKATALEEEAARIAREKAEFDEDNRQVLEEYGRQAQALRVQQDEARGHVEAARKAVAEAEKAEALARSRLDPEAPARLEAARMARDEADQAIHEADQAAGAVSAALEGLRRQHAEAKALAALVDEIHDGEACPLCGGRDHPAPAHPDAETLRRIEEEGKAALATSNQASARLLEATRVGASARAALEAAEVAARVHAETAAAMADLETATSAARAALQAAEAELGAIQIPPPPDLPVFPDADRLKEIAADLAFYDLPYLRETIREADGARIRIEEGTKRAAANREAEAAKRESLANLQALGAGLPAAREALQMAQAALDAESHAYVAAKADQAAGEEGAKSGRYGLEAARARKAARDMAASDLEARRAELAEWRLLERAIEGVRDLELDALAPSIADIATTLLRSSGDTGRIEIETTRISSGSAKRAKQIEDFLIFYTDESGESQDIATCSGGEMVWQRKALYDAFSVMRSRNAGIRFTTGLLDETDGALHPTRKMDYFRMLEAAHRESGRYQTILITQSSELAAMASRVIDVTTLGPKAGSMEIAA